jgi:hypothetical protein
MTTGDDPGLDVRRPLCELPLVPYEERHRSLGAIGETFCAAAIHQPGLELVRRGLVVYSGLQDVPLNRETDAVRIRIPHATLSSSLARIEGAEQAAAEFRRRQCHCKIST